MQKFFLPVLFFSLILFTGCSKKHTPTKSTPTITYEYDSSAIKEKEPEVVVKKTVVKKKTTPTFPKVITVNDAAAKKSVDGRLYYDVEGHRYWKNFKDGKYYLFDKSMYKNPEFKPPRN